MRLRHVGIVVTDLTKSKEFWCSVLGGLIYSENRETGKFLDNMLGIENVDVTTVKLRLPGDNVGIELLKFHSHPDDGPWLGSPYSIGITHIAITTNDLVRTYKSLQQIGVGFANEPQYSPDGNVKVIYAQGPDNVLVELVQELNADG